MCLLILISGCSNRKNAPEASEVKLTEINETRLNSLLAESAKPYHVVNFYATFCKPCIKELPELIELDKDPEVAVHFVSMDDKRVIQGSLSNFMKVHNLSETFYFPEDSAQLYIQKNYPDWNTQIPLSFVIHKSGRIIAQKGLTDKAELKMIIAEDKSFQ